MTALQQQGAAAKAAAYVLATAGTARKNKALEAIADILGAASGAVGSPPTPRMWPRRRPRGCARPMLDRLTLTPERIAGIVDGVRPGDGPAGPHRACG